MAQFIKFKATGHNSYVNVDAIKSWFVEEKRKVYPNNESDDGLLLRIDNGDPETYLTYELGCYSIEDAEAAVIYAIEQPGTVSDVPYKEKSQQNEGKTEGLT